MLFAVDNVNETLADAVIDRPREFFIGNRRFCLWSPSLGMSMMISRHLKALEIDCKVLSINHSMESLRLVSSKRDTVCYILSIMSFRRYSDFCDSSKLKERAEFFSSHLDDSELARLFLLAVSEPTAEMLIRLSGIDKEQLEQSRIARHKNKDGHTITFGGKTIYGSMIDIACRTYGWTKEYVVWGIDLLSLKLMLADNINSVYLSDEDLSALGLRNSGSSEVYGMTPEDIAKLKAMDWS